MFFDPNLRKELIAALNRQTVQFKRSADSLDGIETSQKDALALMGRIVEAQEFIAETVAKLYKKLARPSPPGALSAKIREVSNMAFVADVTLPDWSAALLVTPDIQFATIYCNIAGVETTHQVDKDVATFTSPEGAEGDTCVLSMTYTDDANPPLESAKSPELSLLFADVQPPPAPLAMTAIVREV